MTGEIKGTGLATAVAMAGGLGELAADAEQDDLFEPEGAALPMRAPVRSGPQGGRPKGARNKSTEQWRQYLLERYRSPLVGLLEMYSRSPQDLARELGLYVWNEGKQVVGPKLDADGVQLCDEHGRPMWEPVLATGEAFKRQVEAMIAALPYLHQKLPIAIEAAGDKRGLLVIGDLTVNADFSSGDLNLAPIDAEDVTADAADEGAP